MVFFTCNACGESVKKIQVEKHVAVCRNCECLSCIDCGKDFWGEDYKNHVKCISEDQKYGGKGFEGKAHKGDIKQQAWVQEPASKGQDHQPLNPVAKPPAEITTTVAPSKASDTASGQAEAKKNKRERKEERQKKRKKEKKELKLENHQEKSKSQKSKKRKLRLEAEQEAGGEGAPEAKGNKSECGVNGDVDKAGKRKRKLSEVEAYSKKKKMKCPALAEGGEPENHEAPAKGSAPVIWKALPSGLGGGGKFNWKGTIKAVLKQAPDNEIAVKKLRKKVLAQYYAVTAEHHRSEEELLAIFNKKVSKNPAFKLLKDKVKLLK
ncbi:cell growth-regulating nucleolar protein isoform X3 [Pipistrellus kuhlii]|uniref:cell growth-regulating nucleolar protein isoform X3 n=1 Tax=Pipistrellus kuhlii TaxID=59472 RepID=UPI001E271139|nr:cell growth-regulating nucleolar protein isoform X3 [Pipistrellus kuhlii]